MCVWDVFPVSCLCIRTYPTFALPALKKSSIKHNPLTLAACCQGQNQRETERGGEKERERERERESEREAQLESTSPFLSRPLSPSRLAIRNHDNRWEPPPGSAWECSGIIASGTPSTITHRGHTGTGKLAGKLERPGSDWQPWHTNMCTGEKG